MKILISKYQIVSFLAFEFKICLATNLQVSLYFLNLCISMFHITLDDVQIVLYQEEDGCVVWEANGEFNSSDVHKQVAISFRTPAYKTNDVR